MGREPADGVDARLHDDGLLEDPHMRRPVDQRPAQRASRLIADHDDAGALAPEVVLKVVEYAAARHHPRAGQDDHA